MQWTSALSVRHDCDDAVAEVSASIVDAFSGERPDLLFVFATQHHARHFAKAPATMLSRTELAGAALVGCSGAGVIGGGKEMEQQPALAVMAARLPDVTVSTHHLEGTPSADRQVELGGDPCLVLLADPFTFEAESWLTRLDEAFAGAPIVGGLASGGTRPGSSHVFVGDRAHTSGAALLALSGDVALEPIIAQGCRPIGEAMLITSCDKHVIYRLGDKTPMDVLQELHDQLDERDRALFRHSLFVGLEMKDQTQYQAGDFLIRNIIGVDSEHRALAVAAPVRRFQALQFHLRDRRTAAEDLSRQLALFDAKPAHAAARGALLFSCVGRGRGLYGVDNHDSGLFIERVGEVPLAGFFCNGEIGPVGGKTFTHGYTSAFAVFRPRREAVAPRGGV